MPRTREKVRPARRPWCPVPVWRTAAAPSPKDTARADHQPPALPSAVTRLGEPNAPFPVVSVPELTQVDWSRLNPDEWLPLIYVTGDLPKRATRTDRDC